MLIQHIAFRGFKQQHQPPIFNLRPRSLSVNLLNKNIGKGSYAHETPQSTEAQGSSSLPAGITMLLSVTLLLNIWEYGTTLGGKKA